LLREKPAAVRDYGGFAYASFFVYDGESSHG
jgi:hypothetical protein